MIYLLDLLELIVVSLRNIQEILTNVYLRLSECGLIWRKKRHQVGKYLYRLYVISERENWQKIWMRNIKVTTAHL